MKFEPFKKKLAFKKKKLSPLKNGSGHGFRVRVRVRVAFRVRL